MEGKWRKNTLWKNMFGPKSATLQFILQIIFACLCSVTLANNERINIRAKEKAILDQILTNGKYDARIRPSGINGTDGPVLVNVSMFVRSTPNIDDIKQEYSVQLTFRQQWVDERLKFDDMGGKLKYLTVTLAERMWMPDLFFLIEKESHFHNVLRPNAFFRIFPNGVIYYSVRISLTLHCFMNFRSYPFDRQDCPLRMASCGSTTDDLVFLWKEGDPIQVVRSQEMHGYTLKGYEPDYCPIKTIARVTTLLTMVIQVSNINASSPPVSYFKAVDIWSVVCLIFIFGTLLEFATLNYGLRCDAKRNCEQADTSEIHCDTKVAMKTWTTHCRHMATWLSRFSRSGKIDIVSRITFPIAFTLFNLANWITYLTPDEY